LHFVSSGQFPYWQFVPWVAQHGVNLPLFVRELFANRISAFFGADVLVSAVVLIVFMRIESAWLNIPRRWLPVLAVVTVGVSLGLPMFLYAGGEDGTSSLFGPRHIAFMIECRLASIVREAFNREGRKVRLRSSQRNYEQNQENIYSVKEQLQSAGGTCACRKSAMRL
jgi:hypothetical protein